MKIICLGNYFSTGGAQMDVVLLAKMLGQKGHDAQAWFFARTGDLDTGDTPYRIFSETKPRNPIALIKMLYRFVKACKEYKPDAIIGFYPFSNVIGALAKTFGLSKALVATQRNPSDTQSPAFYHLEKILGCTRAYTYNICISQSVTDSFEKYPKSYKDKIKIVYNGVPPMVKTTASKKECRARFDFLEGQFVIGSLGRLHKQKNIPFLIKCMEDLPELSLAIAGSGPDLEDVKALVQELSLQDRIRFVGELANEDITQFYKAIDVFAMPSIYEGFGRTLVEAFEIGAPVVCSDIPVLQEVSGGAAIPLPLEQKQWIETLKKTASGKIDTAELVEKGKARALDFSLDVMIEGYLDAAKGGKTC